MTEERQGTPLIDGLVSVIMPVYNDTMYIRDAVQSVLRQTYPSWELWINYQIGRASCRERV